PRISAPPPRLSQAPEARQKLAPPGRAGKPKPSNPERGRRPASRKSVRDYNRPMPLAGDGSSRSEQSPAIRLVVDRIPAFTWSAHPDGSVEFVNQRWREY